MPLRALALLGLGRCLVERGHSEPALEPLTSARDLSLRMGARPWVAAADALLEAIAGIETPAGANPAGA